MISGSDRLYVKASSSHGLTHDTCIPGCKISPENNAEIELVVQMTISAHLIASAALVASMSSAATLPRHSSTNFRRDSDVGLNTLTCFKSRIIAIATRCALACQPDPSKAMGGDFFAPNCAPQYRWRRPRGIFGTYPRAKSAAGTPAGG